VPLTGGEPVSLSELRGQPALAFAGIAEPEYFFDELRSHGIDLVKTIALADHTGYSAEQNTALNKVFQDSGAAIVLTTEKDGVKLRGLPEELAAKVLLVRLKLVLHDPAQLTGMLRNLLQ
jgi:tetraacyldisaccharide 4'-kinase